MARLPGGCPLNSAANEFDDQPGAVRDAVEAGLADGRRMLANAVRMAIETGELRPDTDIDQFVFEFTGIVLVSMQNQRLFKDKDANRRALDAFERLVREYATPRKKGVAIMEMRLPLFFSPKISTTVRFLSESAGHRLAFRVLAPLAPRKAGDARTTPVPHAAAPPLPRTRSSPRWRKPRRSPSRCRPAG